MKKKKKIKKKVKSGFFCEVPDCSEDDVCMVWRASGITKRVCKYHTRRHNNENDDFNLFAVFKVPKLELGVDVDKFGTPIPRDQAELLAEIKKDESGKADVEKKKSLKKLKKWKEDNKDAPKYKPRPRLEHDQEKRKAANQQEMDDVIGNILGD